MMYKFNANAYYTMSEIRQEIEDKIKENKGNKELTEKYKEQLVIVNKCINSLYY